MTICPALAGTKRVAISVFGAEDKAIERWSVWAGARTVSIGGWIVRHDDLRTGHLEAGTAGYRSEQVTAYHAMPHRLLCRR
jgi:hypothetical protein